MFSENIKPHSSYRDYTGMPDEDDPLTIEILKILGWHQGVKYTEYRGVTVVWDEDHDERVLLFIDSMHQEDKEYLVGISEHEGCVTFVWMYQDNPKYRYEAKAPGPDLWSCDNFVIGKRTTESKFITYADALKSPRWQRKRLEIMKRDNFECQHCGDKESQLHVHHRRYLNNKMPWEYDDIYLITLCDSCHAKQHGRAA